MIISLDYDDTFTKDVYLWQDFIDAAHAHGHTIYVITSRDKDTPVEYEDWFLDLYNIEVIYCAFKAKRKVAEELGIKVDVWIDDNPYRIDVGYVE